jgi:hypothetical protein
MSIATIRASDTYKSQREGKSRGKQGKGEERKAKSKSREEEGKREREREKDTITSVFRRTNMLNESQEIQVRHCEVTRHRNVFVSCVR